MRFLDAKFAVETDDQDRSGTIRRRGGRGSGRLLRLIGETAVYDCELAAFDALLQTPMVEDGQNGLK